MNVFNAHSLVPFGAQRLNLPHLPPKYEPQPGEVPTCAFIQLVQFLSPHDNRTHKTTDVNLIRYMHFAAARHV